MRTQEQLLPHGYILRYTFPERLVHWIAGFSYLYLLLTGLAFWSPWLFWLAVIAGGAPVSRMLHPWIGLIFFFGIVQMYLMWSSQMHFTDVDRIPNFGCADGHAQCRQQKVRQKTNKQSCQNRTPLD